MVSLVIPTYNEKENIKKLIPEIFRVFKKNNLNAEVIIVDDNSPDGTVKAAEEFTGKYNIKIVYRKGKFGLSSAVLDGFIVAKGDILGVMDADFSHPVEKIPEMVEKLSECDMVIGSRKIKGGNIENWPFYRRIISSVACLFAKPLTSIKDPMSGFFFINKSILDDVELDPKGFKIALEIAVRCKPDICEVPITFRNRIHGKSKMNHTEILNYLKHLSNLYVYKMKQKLHLRRKCSKMILK